MWSDATPDRLVDALRFVMSTRANELLESLWADVDADGNPITYPAVDTTIGAPVVRSTLKAERLPLLSVVRRSTRYAWGGKRRERTATILVEWYGPLTPQEQIRDRWPVLNAIFEALVASLDGVVSGTNVLVLAGVRDIPEEEIRADFNWATNPDLGSNVIPFLSMQFNVRHTADGRALHELDGSVPFLELRTRYLLRNLPASEQPLITTLTRTPAGEAVALAQGEPIDDAPEEEFAG